MQGKLSGFDVRLIRNLVGKETDADIASLLDRPVELVAAKIGELISDDPKLQHAVNLVHERVRKQQERADNKRKFFEEKQRQKAEKEQKDRARAILQHQEAQRRKLREKPQFATRTIDYSQMQTVRIDNRTTIYVKVGDDVEEAKQRYLKQLKSRSVHA